MSRIPLFPIYTLKIPFLCIIKRELKGILQINKRTDIFAYTFAYTHKHTHIKPALSIHG